MAAALTGGNPDDLMPPWLRDEAPENLAKPPEPAAQGNAFMGFASMLLGVPVTKEEAASD